MTTKTKKNVPDKAFVESLNEPTLYEWLVSKIDEAFVENIPLDSMKELPANYMYLFGFIAYIASLFCFLYFTYTGYIQQTTKEFITPNSNDGDCSTVLRTVDGTYYADFIGQWSGESNFQYSNALYQLNLNNFRYSLKDYSKMMKYVGQQLDYIGAGAYDRNLAGNIMYWISWQVSIPDPTSANTFQMLGSPSVIFDRQFRFGMVGNVNGECLVTRDTSYDRANNLFQLKIDVSEFLNDSICKTIAVPSYMGYIPLYDFNDFKLKLDIRSFVIAFAVNYDILDLDDLEVVTGTGVLYNVSGVIVRKTERFFERYPGHSAVQCLEFSDAHICGLQFGATFAIPIFHHYGTGKGIPENCNCSLGHNSIEYCSIYDFMISVLWYNLPADNIDEAFRLNTLALLDLVFRYPKFSDLNNAAYNISYAAAQYGIYDDITWRKSSYNFCATSFNKSLSCSILMFNTYDEISTIATDFYYQIQKGACNNSFSIGAWNNLRKNPPTDLTQDYFVCTSSPTDAMFASVGIAAGNAATFVPMFLFGLLPLIYLYLQTTGKLPPKEEYSKQELDAASDALALIILRIRDGKIRGVNSEGILTKLTAELVKSAKSEGGYPDSDDDSDDETRDSNFDLNQPKTATHLHLKSSIFIKKKKPEIVEEEKSPFWKIFGENQTKKEPDEGIAMRLTHTQRGSVSEIHEEFNILNHFDQSSMLGMRSISTEIIMSAEIALNLVQTLKSGMGKAFSVKDKDGAINVFRPVQQKTIELRNINLQSVFESNETIRIFFLQLYDTIAMHGSITLKCPISDISEKYENKIGYQIGSRIYSAHEIFQLANSDDFDYLSLGTQVNY